MKLRRGVGSLANKLDYHQSVNYSQADPMKILAQKEGLYTAANMPFNFKEISGTRGESAYVFSMGDYYGALVQEGLGTKSLIAQAVYKDTGKNNFSLIAQDTVACIINDLVSVGATPVVLNAYWSSSSYSWLADNALAEDFIKGWRSACDKSKVVWGGGETQSLPGIISEGSLEFAGSAFGVIKQKSQLIQGKNILEGDAIVLIESSGVHANGISLTRQIAERLSIGYETKLPSGKTFGEVLLTPTHLYAELVLSLQKESLDIHYLSNITGHGWRKIMRAEQELTYTMHAIPPVTEIFEYIAAQSENSPTEMYSNYNMGAGYAVYLPKAQAHKVIQIAEGLNLKAWDAGIVKAGPKQVIIEPLDITFSADSLEVR